LPSEEIKVISKRILKFFVAALMITTSTTAHADTSGEVRSNLENLFANSDGNIPVTDLQPAIEQILAEANLALPENQDAKLQYLVDQGILSVSEKAQVEDLASKLSGSDLSALTLQGLTFKSLQGNQYANASLICVIATFIMIAVIMKIQRGGQKDGTADNSSKK
jgi:hypothetical protein